MKNKTLVSVGLEVGVAETLGVLECELRIKTSRLVVGSRHQADLAARQARYEAKKAAELREQRKCLRVVETALKSANMQPINCKKLVQKAERVLPPTHKIILVPAKVGFHRKLQAMAA